jgi:vitamin B12 transporter
VTEASDALREVPGLVIVRNGSFGSVTSLFFRGGESDHAKVLVDGVPVNQNGGSFDLSGLLVEDVERIEVVRGPSSALFGSDAMGGVIHIVTRRGDGPLRGTGRVRGGSFGRLDWGVDLSAGSGRTDYAASVNRTSGDGLLAFNNQFHNTVISGSLGHRPDSLTLLRVNGRYGERAYHFPTDFAGNVVDRNSRTFADEASVGLEASRFLTRGLQLQFRGSLYDFDGGTDDRPDSPSDTLGFYGFSSLDEFRRVLGDLRANWFVGQRIVVTGGAEVEKESQDSWSESLSEWGSSPSRDSYERLNVAGYAHLAGEWEKASMNAGARFEDNEQFGEFATFQLGGTLRPFSKGPTLRASVGTGFKEPTFFEAFSTSLFALGNPELDPEKSFAWEIGLDQGVGLASVSLTYFDQTFEDLIQYTGTPPMPEGPNYYNVAKASSRGLEIGASAPIRGVDVSATYTYLRTRVLDSGFDEGEGAVFVEGQRLLRRPDHQAHLGIAWRIGPHRILADGRYAGSRDDRDFSQFPAEPVELGAYALVGAGAEIRILAPGGGRPETLLTLRAENLLDEGYQEVFGFDGPGRAFYLGLRVGLGGD